MWIYNIIKRIEKTLFTEYMICRPECQISSWKLYLAWWKYSSNAPKGLIYSATMLLCIIYIYIYIYNRDMPNSGFRWSKYVCVCVWGGGGGGRSSFCWINPNSSYGRLSILHLGLHDGYSRNLGIAFEDWASVVEIYQSLIFKLS